MFGNKDKKEAKKRIKILEDKIEEADRNIKLSEMELREIDEEINTSRPHDKLIRKLVDGNSYTVVCPYCLNKYHVEDLQFLAQTVADGDGVFDNCFPPEEDAQYDQFWNNLGVNVDVIRPHILNMDPEQGEIKEIVFKLDDIQRRTVEYSLDAREKMKDFQVISVIDKYGHSSHTRICPFCHSELPNDIGFVPNYIISLMGNSYCGKTVYINRIILSLCQAVFMDGNYIGTVSNDGDVEFGERIENKAKKVFDAVDGAMPEPNDLKYIRPVIIRLTNVRTHERIYITLFDFPGEDIWTSDRDIYSFQELAQRNRENASGWIVMFDSGTLTSVSGHVPERYRQIDAMTGDVQVADPSTILNFISNRYSAGHPFDKPVAYVLSKSDLIFQTRTQLEGSLLKADPQFLRKPEEHKKVDLEDLYICDREIREFLADSQVCQTGDVFSNSDCAWFAVSSTSVPVENGQLPQDASIKGLRDTCPIEWILYRCGQIEGDLHDNIEAERWVRSFQAAEVLFRKKQAELQRELNRVSGMHSEIDRLREKFNIQ